jgi:hypothetical protein
MVVSGVASVGPRAGLNAVEQHTRNQTLAIQPSVSHYANSATLVLTNYKILISYFGGNRQLYWENLFGNWLNIFIHKEPTNFIIQKIFNSHIVKQM